MLPFFHRYNHTNYARWGALYLSEMNQLPQAVKQEFQQGNFVVKGSDKLFNQVDADHSLEWLNGVGKKAGGIIGITKTTSALSRWALSYNLCACIAAQTREMFSIAIDDDITPNEGTAGRVKHDNQDENNILEVLVRFKAFESRPSSAQLMNIATKDAATLEIQESLLKAEILEQAVLREDLLRRM